MESQAQRQESARARVSHLDGVRALAAGYVVLHHIWLSAFPMDPPQAASWYRGGGLLDHGSAAVAIFMVVSGYSLSLATLRHDGRLPRGSADFLWRRFQRIVPTYWAALALSVVLGLTLLSEPTGGLWGAAVPFTWQDVVVHVLLLQDAYGQGKINYLLWSIAVEWHIYFLFPLVLLAVRRWTSWVALPVIGLAAVALSIVVAEDAVPWTLTFLLACFVAGVAACRGVHAGGVVTLLGRSRRPPWGLLAAALLLASAVAVAVAGRTLVADVGVACALASLLVAMGTGGVGGVRAALSHPVLTWLGTCSYSLYLTHPLVVQGVFLATRPLELSAGWDVVVLMVVSAPLSVLGAWLFFLAAERPFMRPRSAGSRRGVSTLPSSLPARTDPLRRVS